jgi:hypothetical protein
MHAMIRSSLTRLTAGDADERDSIIIEEYINSLESAVRLAARSSAFSGGDSPSAIINDMVQNAITAGDPVASSEVDL